MDIDEGYMIEFSVSEDALVGYLGAYPNFRRVPLTLPAKRDRDGSPLRYLFGPIPVGG